MLLAVTTMTVASTSYSLSPELRAASVAATSPAPIAISATRATTRAGVDGPIVQPVATCKWGDLLSVTVRGGKLQVESKPPPAIAPYLINRKSAVEIEIADAHERYWRLQGI